MVSLKNLIILKKKIEKEDKKNLYSLQTVGFFHSFLFKKKIAIDLSHPTGGLKRDFFLTLQELYKKNPQYINQNKLKENFFSKMKKLKNYKSSRIENNLPLRGQRTHTNSRTRRERKIL